MTFTCPQTGQCSPQLRSPAREEWLKWESSMAKVPTKYKQWRPSCNSTLIGIVIQNSPSTGQLFLWNSELCAFFPFWRFRAVYPDVQPSSIIKGMNQQSAKDLFNFPFPFPAQLWICLPISRVYSNSIGKAESVICTGDTENSLLNGISVNLMLACVSLAGNEVTFIFVQLG